MARNYQLKSVHSAKVPPEAGGPYACQWSISGRKGHWTADGFQQKLHVTEYKTGAIVSGWAVGAKATGGGVAGRKVKAFTKGARIRCAFAFANAETDWRAMTTLTYPANRYVENDLRKYLKRVARLSDSEVPWGWFREYTTRGRLHYHIFWGDCPLMAELMAEESVARERHGHSTTIPTGRVAQALSASWIDLVKPVVEPEKIAAFVRFQSGGITELLRSTDAAGRYAAKESSKRVQKVLPASEPPGRSWWGLSRSIRPRPRGGRPLEHWPFEKPYAMVFEKSALATGVLAAGAPVGATAVTPVTLFPDNENTRDQSGRPYSD